MRADYEIVMTAVSQNGLALRSATKGLRADRAIVLQAVSQNGWALQHAAGELKAQGVAACFNGRVLVQSWPSDHPKLSRKFPSFSQNDFSQRWIPKPQF